MTLLNVIVGALVGAVLWPFQALAPLAGLAAISLLLALALLAVFRIASNQRALAATKRQIHASLFELRLFEDDPRAVLRAVGDLLTQQMVYLRYALVPMLWIAIPLLLLIVHLQAYYGYDGLRPGEPAVVTAHVKGGPSPRPSLSLEVPPGVRVETPGVWTPSLREMAWRVAADRPGDYELRLVVQRAQGTTDVPATVGAAADTSAHAAAITKRLHVTPLIVPRAVVRPSRAFWAQLQYPAEAPLPDDVIVDAMTIAYPARTIDVFGVSLHWLPIVIVLSTAFAYACRGLFDVVI